jgi:hypothetical protein
MVDQTHLMSVNSLCEESWEQFEQTPNNIFALEYLPNYFVEEPSLHQRHGSLQKLCASLDGPEGIVLADLGQNEKEWSMKQLKLNMHAFHQFKIIANDVLLRLGFFDQRVSCFLCPIHESAELPFKINNDLELRLRNISAKILLALPYILLE